MFVSKHNPPIERFIADFYCHKAKFVIEVDGGVHNSQREYDLGREAELERHDIKVLRFSNEEIFDNLDNVIEIIKLNI